MRDQDNPDKVKPWHLQSAPGSMMQMQERLSNVAAYSKACFLVLT